MLKSTFLNLHDVILVFTIIEIPFLCALLNLLPSKNEQSRNILIFFFLLIAGTLATTLVIWNTFLQLQPIAVWDGIPFIFSGCVLLQGPSLYFYLRSLSNHIQFTSWRTLVHLIPTIAVCGLIVIFDINVMDWRPESWPNLKDGERAAVKFILAVIKCSPLIYVIASFYAQYQLRKELQEMSVAVSSVELRWADIILIGFLAQWLWSFVVYFLSDYVSYGMSDLLGLVNNYLLVVLVNTLFFLGISNTRALMSAPAEVEVKPVDVPRMDEKVLAVERGISDKLYLDSQINLERFAEHVGLRPREVSTVLNTYYESNFFEFINGYRVEEAKRLLSTPENKSTTIQDIIYKSGFNSQSAFHRFFKRNVGQTPSEYRSHARDNNV